MTTLARDIRFALRALTRHPGFALTAIATLALGIGASTAVFSVVDAVLLRPLPYADAARVVVVWGDLRNRNVHDWPFSNPDFADLRTQASSFDGLAAIATGKNAIAGANGESETLRTANATTNIFSVLGLRMARGRAFLDEEGLPPQPPPAAAAAPAPGAPVPPVVPAGPPLPRKTILSYEFWQRHFGGDESIVGHTARLGLNTIEVVGVLEPNAELLFSPSAGIEQRPDVWSPIRVDFTQGNRNNVGVLVLGRLKPTVTVAQAQAEVDKIASDLRKRFAIKETAGLYFRVEPMATDLVADVRPEILALLGAVAFVLLIACANVANLLLVRAAARERELAVRAALGAEQGRLVRQLLTESLTLSAGGALGGLVLAQLGIRLLLRLKPDNLPRIDTIAIDPTVLGFAAFATVVSAVTFGLVPAIRASRPDLIDVLRQAGRSSALASGARLRSLVVVSEVALSFVLLIGCGLMLRSFIALGRVDPGFNPQGVLTFALSGQPPRDPDQAGAFMRAFSEKIAGLPGVRGVTVGTPLPLDGGTANARYGTEAAASDPGKFQQADVHLVAPSYFDVLGTRVVEGRVFADADNRRDAMVVVIDTLTARKAFPGESAVGKRLLSRIRTDEAESFQVIGVVEHQRQASLAEPGREAIFFAEGLVGHIPGGRWVVRADGDPMALVGPIRQALASLPGQAVLTEPVLMSTFVERASAKTRFALTLITVFAVTAVLLAVVGLYSVLSTVVRQRTAEIGVRIAFGAERSRIFSMMVGQGLWLILTGLGIGLLAAGLLTGTLRSLLVGVSPTDPLTFLAVGAVFLGVAVAAAGIPAWRAARLDPTVALRRE